MDDEDLAKVAHYVAHQTAEEGLSRHQRRDVLRLLVIVVLGLGVVIAFAFFLRADFLAERRIVMVAPEKAANKLLENSAFIDKVRAGATPVPAGAVLAFARTDGCPDGWSAFTPAHGRIIVGAGHSPGLTPRRFGETGGSETTSQPAAHQHTLPVHANRHDTMDNKDLQGYGLVADGAGSGDIIVYNATGPMTTSVAGAVAVSNMPPYVALHLCRKD